MISIDSSERVLGGGGCLSRGCSSGVGLRIEVVSFEVLGLSVQVYFGITGSIKSASFLN